MQSHAPISALKFAGKFRLIPYPEYQRQAFSPQASLEINEDTLNIQGGRRKAYVETVQALKKKVETQLPDHVTVEMSVSNWGGNSAYDEVAITVQDPEQKIIAREEFFRSINDYEGLGFSMLVPKLIRDAFFSRRVMKAARALLEKVQQNPTQSGLISEKEYYTGLW